MIISTNKNRRTDMDLLITLITAAGTGLVAYAVLSAMGGL